VFAKVFNQIYDSSIVENPEMRFTFMDFLVLADCNGVVDMTHEAIARRTNRPIETIRETITGLENPDLRSRTPDFDGARIKRLDEHRDWGWFIVNFDKFKKTTSQEQRREKTLLRVRKHRSEKGCNASVTQCNAVKRKCNAFPSPSLSVLKKGIAKGKPDQAEIEAFCESIGLPKSDGEVVFNKWQGNGWVNGGKPIKDWKATIRAWKGQGYMPSQKGKNETHRGNRAGSNRNDGTTNANGVSDYSTYGKA
jgi:hypothetical protein